MSATDVDALAVAKNVVGRTSTGPRPRTPSGAGVAGGGDGGSAQKRLATKAIVARALAIPATMVTTAAAKRSGLDQVLVGSLECSYAMMLNWPSMNTLYVIFIIL
jgi:hypothetical protein